MQIMQRDSLVVTNAGQFGRVESIRVFTHEGRSSALLKVYLLLEGRTDEFLADELQLRTNNDHEIVAHMRMEPEPIPVEAVF